MLQKPLTNFVTMLNASTHQTYFKSCASSLTSSWMVGLLILMLLVPGPIYAQGFEDDFRCDELLNQVEELRMSSARQMMRLSNRTARCPHMADENGHECWATDGLKAQQFRSIAYDSVFYEGLERKPIDELALEARGKNQRFDVLDLFGSAVFSVHPDYYTSLTGVRFAPLIKAELTKDSIYPAPNWDNLIGNLLYYSTWNQIKVHMKKRSIPGFQLIIIRPYGPLLALDNAENQINRDTFSQTGTLAKFAIANRVINRAFDLLAPDGQMLVELTRPIVNSPDFWAWTTSEGNADRAITVYNNAPVPHAVIQKKLLR